MRSAAPTAQMSRIERTITCPSCASGRVRPFLPLTTGVEYRCRECGARWAVPRPSGDDCSSQ